MVAFGAGGEPAGRSRDKIRVMKHSAVDRHFRAYLRNGHPRHLAKVFDAVASELLAVANHLMREPADAEDLVQSTFLLAIERSETYDRGRSVLPWLVGILVNRARNERRRRRRSLDPDRLPPEPVLHAGDEAQSHEVRELVHGALAELPDHYSSVLRLVLVHGMTNAQIARALGRSRETVKTQHRRGMELLRRALPPGLASAALLSLSTGRGLAMVRATVLSRAAARAAASGALPGAAVGLGARWLGGLVAVALAVGLVVRWWPRSDSSGVEVARTSGRVAAVPPVAGEHATRPPAAGPVQRVAVNAPARSAGELQVEIRWSDGSPAAGVRVAAVPATDPSWLRERWQVAGADGRVRFRASGEDLRVYTGRGAASAVVAAGQRTAALELARGVEVWGHVLDRLGRPAAGAALWLVDHSGGVERGVVAGRAGADGSFALRDVEPGRFLTARVPGALAPPVQEIRGGPGERQALELRMGADGALLRGQVLGEAGVPVAGAGVLVGWSPAVHGRRYTPPYRTWTDAEGRFEATAPAGLAVPVFAGAPGYAVDASQRRFGVGVSSLVLRLRRGAVVSGVVRDAAGRAVAGVEVAALQRGIDPELGRLFYGPPWARRRARTDAGGRFSIRGVVPGRAVLRIAAEAGQAQEVVQLADGEAHRWDPRLSAGVPLFGVVRSDEGEPLGDWVVAAQPPAGRRRIAVSGPDGRFEIADCVPVEHELRVRERRSVLRADVFDTYRVEPGQEVTLVVPSTEIARGHLRGRVVGPAGEGKKTMVALIRCDEGRRDIVYREPGADDGRFDCGPLPASTYRLVATRSDLGARELGTYELAIGQQRDLGELRLEVPGAAAVRVWQPDGTPAAIHRVDLRRRGQCWHISVPVEGGVARKAALQPGHYSVLVWTELIPPAYAAFEVAAGATATVDLAFDNGVPRQVHFGPIGDTGVPITTRAYDAGGRLLFEEIRTWPPVAQSAGDDLRWERAFVPGEYTFEFESPSGTRRHRVRIDAAGSRDDVVELPVR